MLRNESLWLSPVNPRQVSCPWRLHGIKKVLFLPSSLPLPPSLIFLQCFSPSISLSASLYSFASCAAPHPCIPGCSYWALPLPSGTCSPPQFSWVVSILSLPRSDAQTRSGGGTPRSPAFQPPYSAGRRRGAGRGRGEGFDFHLLEESWLLIPGRTCRGEGDIISFPDGQVWGSFEFLHITGEEQGGGGEGENGEKTWICLWGALHFPLLPTNCLSEKSHSGTFHQGFGQLPRWQAVQCDANDRSTEGIL